MMMNNGQTLPQNTEAEQAVLGAVLIDGEAISIIMEHLKSPDFYLKSHQIIFDAMIETYSNGDPVDLITVVNTLNRNKQLDDVGGIKYLSDLSRSVPTSANLSYYIEIVNEKATLRRLIHTAVEIANTGYDESGKVQDLLNTAEQQIMKVSRQGSSSGFVAVKSILMDVFEKVEYLYANKGNPTGIKSGFNDLDKMTSGFQKSDLIIVAARPSVGKTAFALNIAQNVGIRTDETVAIFSLEMGATQLVQRMLCAEANVDAGRMRTGYLESDDWNKLTMAISMLSNSNIYIDDSSSLTVADIQAKCRRLKAEQGNLGMILIDYLQLIQGRGKGENRQQEVSEISRTLKQLARELDVPIIALSQLSRGVEQRQDKRPMMSDLRESGSIEQDADIVAFLYRDDYYDKESEKKNIIEIIIAKQRNGPVGTVELAFLKNFNKFVGLDREHHADTA